MNQIIYKEEPEIKHIKKKSKILTNTLIILICSILLGCCIFGIFKIYEMNKPVFIPEETSLDLYIYENNIIIEAHNSQGLENISYKWQGKDSYSAYPAEKDKSNLSVTIPILSGENTLYVEVLDSNGNIIKKQQKIKGVTEAKINIKVQEGYFVVNVTDDVKIKSIQYEYNNLNYNVEIGEVKQFEFMQKLDYGTNNIKVTVCNSQDIYTTEEMQYVHN